jgi:signal transduction histidine kinase
MKLRARFTLWFALAALVPIAVAALITREVLSTSQRRDFARQRAAAEAAARRELARLEASVSQPVRFLASSDHPLIGGLLLDLRKFGQDPELLRRLRQDAEPAMRGLGLDLLYIVAADDTVLAAPHYRPANDELQPVHARRAAQVGQRAFYTSEPRLEAGAVRQQLAVMAVRSARDQEAQVTVAGGLFVGASALEPVRQAGRIDARIVDAAGRVLVAPGESWGDWRAARTMRLALHGDAGTPVAWVEIALSDAELQRVLAEVSMVAIALAVAALVVAIILGFWGARRMIRPIDALVDGVQAAARGDLAHRVQLSRRDMATRDEIAALAGAFNAMMGDLQESKEKLVMAERVAAWQEIARRLAHEIKNPLTPIQMSVETLRKTFARQHPSFAEVFEESTRTVLEETARLKRIVGEFASFARLPRPHKQPCDLNQLAASALVLYQGSIVIDRELAADLPRVLADRDQLVQLILNLLENARDAISARTGAAGDAAAPGEPGRVLLTTRRCDDAVELSVDDNGPGVAVAMREQIFAPYFTTRQGQGGTGLGLAIAQRVIAEHGGRLWCEDSPLGGARFTFRLASANGSEESPAP